MTPQSSNEDTRITPLVAPDERARIALRVNGEEREGLVEPRLLLSDFLRHGLGLTGTHVGCEHGVCGACTVLLDGQPVRSCLMLAIQVDGAELQTVEHLAADGALHPLQRAFRENHALQCGFCTPGFLLTALACLRDNPTPTETEVRDALSGNLCRCTGYEGIVDAVLAVARQGAAGHPLGGGAEPDSGRYVGQPIRRVEDARLLAGRGQYVDDLDPPGLLHAAFLRSPYAHARIRAIDAEAARALPGVVAVYTGADLAAAIRPMRTLLNLPGMLPVERQALACERVRFVGEPVAVAVARDRYLAEDALELIAVDYEPLPAVGDVEAASRPDAPRLHDDVPENTFLRVAQRFGEPDRAFARADRVFAKRFRGNRQSASPIETRAVLASFDHWGGELIVWCSSQAPHLLRNLLAQLLDFPEHKLRVISPDVGGGFGMKLHLYSEDAVVPVLAMRLGRPVKWVGDRLEDLQASAHGKDQLIDLAVATSADGEILGFRGRYLVDSGGYSQYPRSNLSHSLSPPLLLPSVYSVRHVGYEAAAVLTNKTPVAAYRGVGWTQAHVARELLLDEAARGLGLDPVAFRLQNLIPDDAFPHATVTGLTYDSGSFRASLEQACALIDYEGFRLEQARGSRDGRYLGIGVSPFVEPTAFGSASAQANGLPARFFDTATVSMDPTGKVTVATGLHSHGQGHATSLAQLAADELGVPFADVTVVEGDTATAPFGMGTFASRSAVVGGGAVTRAARDVRDKLLQIAGQVLEASPADLAIERGQIYPKGVPDRALSVREVAYLAYYAPDRHPPGLDPVLSATRHYDPPETYTNGAAAATVAVDPATGQVEILRLVVVEDCGTILNPLIVDGQIRGATAQGIAGALTEEIVYDADGQLLSGSFMDYLLPTAYEVPRVMIAHIQTPSPVTLGGIKGMGEGPTIVVPAAIACAVADALAPLGARVDRLPLTPERVYWLANAGAPLTPRPPLPLAGEGES